MSSAGIQKLFCGIYSVFKCSFDIFVVDKVVSPSYSSAILGRPPPKVRCRIQDAWGWCTGMTQRDGTGREVGGGFRMGNTCTPVGDSC